MHVSQKMKRGLMAVLREKFKCIHQVGDLFDMSLNFCVPVLDSKPLSKDQRLFEITLDLLSVKI